MDIQEFIVSLLDLVFFVFVQAENFVILAAAAFLFFTAIFNLIIRFMRGL